MSDALKKRLLDKSFRYTRASETDIAKLFQRIKRAQKEAEKQPVNVKKLERKHA
jgi:hypothetical protein